jgi:DNA polymerase IV
MAWYLHIDMDAFYASVEQVLDPSLIGRAVIVGGRSGRGVVTSASYEARKFGVRSAMPGFQARRLCPHGIFLRNRRRAYVDFSRRVFAILKQYSPEVHALSIDEGLINLSGTDRLFGPPLKTADTIIRRIENEIGLPSSAGLSSHRVIAKIAATLAKPRGLIYVPAVGPKTRTGLDQKGIKTVGDLLNRGLASRYLDLNGDIERPHRHDHSIGNETTLERPVKEVVEMEKVLWELVEEVGARLRREELYARCLTVKIRYSNFQTITRSRTLFTPTCFDREIFEAVSGLLRENIASGRPVRLLGVSASALQQSGWQEPLFNVERRKSLERLYKGIDGLRRKYGDESIGAASTRDRDR